MGDFHEERRTRSRGRGVFLGIVLAACALVSPVSVPAQATVTVSAVDPTGRIAVGEKHTCAIRNDNTIWCWGDNSLSQLGSSAHSGLTDTATPVQAAALGGGRIPSRIVAGLNHTCVLATDGTVWCWGENGTGAVGDGSLSNQSDPVQVTLGNAATSIAAGGNESCAILSSLAVKCWGKNSFGQVGNGTTSVGESVPVSVSKIPYSASIPGSFSVDQLEVGLYHACAISTTGGAWCWGYHLNGRLGITAGSSVLQPTATSSLGGTGRTVSAGGLHTCVVLTNDTVTCFGRNNRGQLGQNTTTTENATPTTVALSATASAVSAGNEFTCALLTTGAVECFGANGVGQLGAGTTSTSRYAPGAVSGLSGTVVDIVAGTTHACAVMSTGEVRCWGGNSSGQLGVGNTDPSYSAVAIASLNIMPTTTTTTTTTTSTTSTTTTTTSTTTTSTTSTTVPGAVPENPPTQVVAPQTNTTTSSTTTLPASPIKKKKITPIRLRVGRKISAANIAASVSFAIPKQSWGTMRISIMTGGKRCTFSGTSVKAVRRGTCSVAVVLLPKNGKASIRNNTITIS